MDKKTLDVEIIDGGRQIKLKGSFLLPPSSIVIHVSCLACKTDAYLYLDNQHPVPIKRCDNCQKEMIIQEIGIDASSIQKALDSVNVRLDFRSFNK